MEPAIKTRTKKVFDDRNVAHLWANKVQSDARNQRHTFYFEGDTIYSYGRHFPIAVHYKNVVLFTLDTYSNTTAKHIDYVRSAASHKDKIYCLNPDSAAYGNHTRNIDHWIDGIKSEIKNLERSKKPSIYLDKIEQAKGQLNKYLQFFNLKLNKEQQKIIAVKSYDEYKELIQKERAAKERKKATLLKVGKPLYVNALRLWKDYADITPAKYRESLTPHQQSSILYYAEQTSYTTLRTNGIEIETSKGIKLPVEVGKRYYNFFKRIVKSGGCHGNCNYRMLDYKVKSATSEGLVIGCHNIPTEEIEAIAVKLNWK